MVNTEINVYTLQQVVANVCTNFLFFLNPVKQFMWGRGGGVGVGVYNRKWGRGGGAGVGMYNRNLEVIGYKFMNLWVNS